MRIRRYIETVFSNGHPKGYFTLGLLLAMIAVSTIVATSTLAEDATTSSTSGTSGSTTSTSGSTQTSETIACSYSYGSWSACQSDGRRFRVVTSVSPSGCVKTTSPSVVESCSYTAPATEAPTSTTSTPTLTSPLPTTTSTVSLPTSDTTSNTGSTSYATQCSYTYSAWGSCQSNGKRMRTFLSKSPTGCEEYIHPVLEQSCVYDTSLTTTTVSPTSSSSTPTTTTSSSSTTAAATTVQSDASSSSISGVTPVFSFVNVSDGMIVRGDMEIKGAVRGAKAVEYYLVPVGSNTDKYIGLGVHASDIAWNLVFHSKAFPDGEFYLRAKVKNAYGEYSGGRRKIRIANENVVTASSSDKSDVAPILNIEAKKTILQQVKDEMQIPEDTASDVAEKNFDEEKKYVIDYCQSNAAACHPERDSDKDGLNDIDEIRYGTNPRSADSDSDGFIDGDEVKGGFDPAKYSAGDKSDRILFENPKVSGEVKKEMYAVKQVELKDTGAGKKALRLSGKGLPNSFVTIYIYSDPIVLTVKTDSDGNWTYDLDKDLEDGAHEAYVAVTDNTGKITAKSEPIAFVKTAQAATVIPSAQAAPSSEISSVTKQRTQKDLLFLIAIVIAALAVALSTIGLIKHKRSLAKGLSDASML